MTAAGTSGQALISGGTTSPTWYAPTAGSILFAGTSGILQQDNANFFWDDTNNRLGIGTAVPSTLLEVYGSAADVVSTITAADATFDPILKLRTGASPAIQFSLGVDNSDSDKFKIYSGDGLGSGDEFVIDSNGVTTIANLNLGATSFDTDAGIVSWIDMPVTSSATVGTVESYSAQIDGTSFLTIYSQSDGAGALTTTASAVKADVQLDATTDGLATKVSAGACSDTTFTRDTDGTLCIDSTNGRMYFRYGAAWHYVNQTAGFQIPNYETAPKSELTAEAKAARANALPFDSSAYPEYLTERMQPGDFLVPYVDEYLSDGALHGLYARFEDVKSLMFGEEQSQIAALALENSQNITSVSELQTAVEAELQTINGQIETLNAGNQTVQDDVSNIEARTALLESQMTTLSEQVSVLSEFYTTFELGNFVSKDLDGNVDLLGGKLKASILETGGLAIEVVDEEAPTIGTAEILPAAVDLDNDGNDDVTGEPMADTAVAARDGQSVEIRTKAMIPMVNGSRIFTNFKGNPGGFSWVEKIMEDGEYVGFRVKLSAPVTDSIKLDWWLVEQK